MDSSALLESAQLRLHSYGSTYTFAVLTSLFVGASWALGIVTAVRIVITRDRADHSGWCAPNFAAGHRRLLASRPGRALHQRAARVDGHLAGARGGAWR